jgi:mRNA-degrading endonuclease toxin of MazEF toxin-antitoxin module
MVEQGDIIKIDGIKNTALVVSKNLFNESGHAILCPIMTGSLPSTLSYSIDEDKYVLCDNMRQIDIESRGYSVTGRVPLAHLINIVDRIQSLFDYY